MAAKLRYEYTLGWLMEQGYIRAQGIDKRPRARYTPEQLARIEEQHYEQLYRERELYQQMEMGL